MMYEVGNNRKSMREGGVVEDSAILQNLSIDELERLDTMENAGTGEKRSSFNPSRQPR